MTEKIVSGVVTVITAIIGLAILAVLVSRNAQTGNVITSGGSALAKTIAAATGPVIGAGGGSGAFGNLGSISAGDVNYY